MSWITGPLLGFDTETTGVDVHADRIVTAALVRRDAAGTRVRTWLVAPGVEIPAVVTAIHGVTTADAERDGRPPAEALEEIAAELAEAARDGVPVVAYNASFDLDLLDAELRRHGLATLRDRLGGAEVPVVDPFVLDRCEDPDREGARRLVDLCGVYRVLGAGRMHTADVDVLATLDLLAALVRRYPHLGALDLAALGRYQVDARRAWAEARAARRAAEAEAAALAESAALAAAPDPTDASAAPAAPTVAPRPVESLATVVGRLAAWAVRALRGSPHASRHPTP